MNWASGILNASQASYLPLQNNAVLTNRRFEFVGSTQNKTEFNRTPFLFCFFVRFCAKAHFRVAESIRFWVVDNRLFLCYNILNFSSFWREDCMDYRKYWLDVMLQIVTPVLNNLAIGRLRENIPSDFHKRQFDIIELEAFGRVACGIAPWLEVEGLCGEEKILQEKYRALVRDCINMATDPESPDFMNFNDGNQPLVDAAFLAHAILRAPKQTFELLDGKVKKNLINALRSTRCITPHENNWLLFASMVEAALLFMGSDVDERRLTHGIESFANDWYVGDGTYGDGRYYHWDYYNSFVIQPMYIDVLRVLRSREERYEAQLNEALKRASRYAEVLERMIMPDGTYPVVGRSASYRFGAFHLLSQAVLQNFLPENISAGQVRSALTAVIQKCMESPKTFDKDGWLNPGVYGHQPDMAEPYIDVGSLYLCSSIFLPLGLPCDSAFWIEDECAWTSKQIWSGEPVNRDHAVD